MENYGKKIKELRVKNKLTQADLGKQLNVTSQAVSKWENDLSEPDLQSTIKMCDIFGVTINELLDVNAPKQDNETVEEPKTESAQPIQQKVEQPKIIVGYCSVCKKPLYDGEYEVVTHSSGQSLYCEDCWAKKKKQEQKENYDEESKLLRRGIIWGIVAAIFGFLVTLVPSITYKFSPGIGIAFVSALACFTLVSQLFWDCLMAEMFLFFCKTFRMPGVIFEFSFDGLKFLIVAKIILAILSVCLSIGLFLLGIAICVPFSLVTFPFAIVKQVREVHQYA